MTARSQSTVLVEIDREAEVPLEAMAYWLSHASEIFEGIHISICSGHMRADDPFLAALSEVCARAFQAVAEEEGERCNAVAMAIRDSNSRARQADKDKIDLLHAEADEATARGDFQQAAFLRGVAKGEIDPMSRNYLPERKTPAPARKEART